MTEIINFAQGFFVGLITLYLITRRRRQALGPAPRSAPCVHNFGKWEFSNGKGSQYGHCEKCGWTIERKVGRA